MKRVIPAVCVSIVLIAGGAVMAASFRPGRDPAKERILWVDPFDFYSQWSYDNSQFWTGGAVPAGSPSGTYPQKSADGSGCGVSIQTWPAIYEMARAQWFREQECTSFFIPSGQMAGVASFEVNYDPNCGGSGEFVSTRGMAALANYCWNGSQDHTAMNMFKRSLTDRITAFIKRPYDHPNANAVNGTDAHPLIVFFVLDDMGSAGNPLSLFANSYVELSFGDERAPTDYIWRGRRECPPPGAPIDPECCPQGPYPVICQQTREVNGSVSEDGSDLTYLAQNCPPLSSKTWKSIAFGALAMMDKDPCGYAEQGVDAHTPTVDHFAVFDGNVWRQLRNNRYHGLENLPPTGNVALSWPPAPGMKEDNMLYVPSQAHHGCNNFSYTAGQYYVSMKIVTDYVLIYVEAAGGEALNGTKPPWHAAIPRVYKGGFNTISWGVGPGCELDPGTGECKSGTDRQCMAYGGHFDNGYWRTRLDSAVMWDGVLVNEDEPPQLGACCQPNGECIITTAAECSGTFHGVGTVCENIKCCPDPFADTDIDGDVDQIDFGKFQECFTGNTPPPGQFNAEQCECFDRDNDNDVDPQDFLAFDACFSGPNVDTDPACDGTP